MSRAKNIAASLRLAIEAVNRCRELLINADADADDLAEYDAATEGLRMTIEEYFAKLAPMRALAIRYNETSDLVADYRVAHIAALERATSAEAERDAALREVARLNKRNLEISMLAQKWMEAHDCLAAGKPYSFPSPTDLPAALSRVQALETERDELIADIDRARASLNSTEEAVQVLEGALETVSAALHNAVLTITLQLSPDHDDAIAGARALGVTESVLRSVLDKTQESSSRDLSQASSALGMGEP